MTEATFSIKLLTDDEIATASTAQLREMTKRAELRNYATHSTVLDFKLGADVIGYPGAMTAIDRLLTILRGVYADREPDVDTRYGDAFTLQVWSDDESLRQTLRYHRDQAIKLEADRAELTGE